MNEQQEIKLIKFITNETELMTLESNEGQKIEVYIIKDIPKFTNNLMNYLSGQNK